MRRVVVDAIAMRPARRAWAAMHLQAQVSVARRGLASKSSQPSPEEQQPRTLTLFDAAAASASPSQMPQMSPQMRRQSQTPPPPHTLWNTPFPSDPSSTTTPSALHSSPHPLFPSAESSWRWRLASFGVAALLSAFTIGCLIHGDLQQLDSAETEAAQKSKKTVTDDNSVNSPTLRIWGTNTEPLTPSSSAPVQVPYFSSIGPLRDFHMTSKHGAAINVSGDLIQFDSVLGGAPRVTLRGKDLVSVRCCVDGSVWCLGRDGRVSRTFAGKTENVVVPESVTAIDAGQRHVVLLGRTGGIYTSASSPSVSAEQLSQGQLGVESPDLKGVNKVDLAGGACARIACGADHTLALARNGAVYAWGSNRAGQLATGALIGDITHSTRPKEVLSCWNQVRVAPRPANVECLRVAAGGDNSWFVVGRGTEGSGGIEEEILSCGSGMWGQLGHGGFQHLCNHPHSVRGPGLSAKQYNELTERVETINAETISVGSRHVFLTLASGARRDVLSIGQNENGTLRRDDCKRGNRGSAGWVLGESGDGRLQLRESVWGAGRGWFSSGVKMREEIFAGDGVTCVYWKVAP